MPEFYGSQRLFWYLIVATTLNGASLVVLTYFLYMRAKAGSTAVYHFLGLFERCLPAWWKQRRIDAERESVAQLVTSAIALGYLLHSLTLISGPALFDDNDPSVRKGGIPSTWPCSVVGAFEQYFSLLSVGCAGFLAPYMSHKLVVQHKRPETVARTLGSRITLISTVAFAVTACVLFGTQWSHHGQVFGPSGCWCWVDSGNRRWTRIRALVVAMVSFYLFVFIGIIYSAWVLLEMRREVSGLRTSAEDKPRLERIGSLYLSAETARENVARRLTMSIYAYIILWIPPLIIRIIYFSSQVDDKVSRPDTSGEKTEEFVYLLILQICVSTQGLFFGLVCMLSDATLKAMMHRPGRRRVSQEMSASNLGSKHLWALFRKPHKSNRFLRGASQRQATEYHLDRQIVVATLNCAERKTVAELCGGDRHNALADLLPLGADVYALGVQECQCWSELRQAVLAHLGDEFVVLGTAQLGAAFLKGTIGIVLFARRDDADAGFVAIGDPGGGSAMAHDDAATGLARRPGTAIMPLGAGARGAHTKGAACVRVRVGDSWLAFLACHLPADAAGNARRRQRRASLAHVLQGCGRQLEPRFQSAHAAAQHAFVLGDLNFRAVDGRTRCANHVRAPLTRGGVLACFPRNGPDSLVDGHTGQLVAPANGAVWRGVHEGWEAALKRDDELREDVQAGKCLYTFREAEHYFPPTFKRRPGVVFDPADAMASYAVVKVADDFKEDSASGPKAKSLEERLRRAKEDLHKGKAVSAAAAAARHGLRYPSWTDRVLFGALPHAGKDLEATSYSVAEELIGTDHRGVVLTAVLKADATRARLYARASSGLPSRKELGESGFATLTASISDIAIAWEESATEDDVEALRGSLGADADEDDPDVPDAASGSQGSALSGSVGAVKRSGTTVSTSSRVSGRIVKHMSSAFDDDDVGFLTLAFPLPCEDPLSSARRARTVARDLDGFEGLAKKSDTCGFYEQIFEAPWAGRAVAATAAHVHPHLARHALLGVLRPDRRVLAAAIVALPDAGPTVVSTPLTRAGRLVGTLAATVEVRVEESR